MNQILNYTEHRPYPLPDYTWIMEQNWYNLLFIHYEVPIEVIQPLIPAGLDLDLFEGKAYIAVVPFGMKNIRFRFLPQIPYTSSFLELNVRTYVKYKNKPGVYFFSLDAENYLAVEVARWLYHLPYLHAEMNMSIYPDQIRYSSLRKDTRGKEAYLEVAYQPTSEVYYSKNGSLENWLTERYCLFSTNFKGNLYICEIHHLPWPLQKAKLEIYNNTMMQSHSIIFQTDEPILHFVKELDVLIYPLKKI